VLALIPARAGSKRLPEKNVAPLAGKPLIHWTIEAARAARTLDRIVVSTDSPEIARIAKRARAETPFLRPASLATDRATSLSVVLHALAWLQRNDGYVCDYVLLLQPTSPLRTASDIDAAVRIAQVHACDAVVSVSPTGERPAWLKRLTPGGRLRRVAVTRREPAGELYMPNGAIYLSTPTALRAHHTWYTSDTRAYIMPRRRSLDIDTSWDLHIARLILTAGRSQTRRRAD
jgi:N-acylneuraminate cytidylyltransferase/CMP-N,N'-diacetyllegionaminic acid synthase